MAYWRIEAFAGFSYKSVEVWFGDLLGLVINKNNQWEDLVVKGTLLQ